MKSVFAIFVLSSVVACGNTPGQSDNTRTQSLAASGDTAGGGEQKDTPAPTGQAAGLSVVQTNLVADQDGIAAVTDPDLINAWGLSFLHAGPAWVSAADAGVSQVYDAGGKLLLSVGIPPPSGDSSAHPTGQASNAEASRYKGDKFIFVTEGGTIAGWQDGAHAITRHAACDGAVYKGVALSDPCGGRLYAADFRNAKVDVFDPSYAPTGVTGGFIDAELPANFSPFNVYAHDKFLVVAFAKQETPGGDEEEPGAGNGAIDVFDCDGTLVSRLIRGDELDAPWGLAAGALSGDEERLFVGNFGDGKIHAYTVDKSGSTPSAKLDGALATKGHSLVIDGLWALVFGNGEGAFKKNQLFFTAGPEEESHGLFGRLDAE